MEKQFKKIKILFTIPNFDTAGSGKVLYDLAKGLNKNLFEVHIACSHSNGSFFKDVETLGFTIHIIEVTCKPRPYYSLFTRIKPFKNFIKKNKFDIVHSWHWSSDWTEVLATRLGGAKFVYTKKAMTWGNIHWKIKSYLSNFIITINEEMRNYFPYKKGQKLIPLGLDTNYYNPELFDINKNSVFKIITVANLVPVKGIEILIKAIKELNNNTIYLEIIGDDKTQYALELKKNVNELNLQNQISFFGKYNDVRPFLAQSDLYVIPSLKEGMPMALVEAMSMAKPVLGSNISGVNYVLKDFRELLFEAKNVKELSEKIDVMYNMSKKEKVELGNKLRTYCMNHFSYDKFIVEHEILYKKLVN
jgi:glycosyltransferase involved in cell wall biosynthesis